MKSLGISNQCWLDFERETAYMDAVNLGTVIIKPVEDGWLLIAKGTRRKERVVSFTFAHTMTDCLREFFFKTQYGMMRWKKDEYS